LHLFQIKLQKKCHFIWRKIYKIQKLKNGKKIFGTGFFCKIPFPDEFRLLPVFITCNHILDKKDIIPNKIINISMDDEQFEKTIKLNIKEKLSLMKN